MNHHFHLDLETPKANLVNGIAKTLAMGYPNGECSFVKTLKLQA